MRDDAEHGADLTLNLDFGSIEDEGAWWKMFSGSPIKGSTHFQSN